jgi:hypothetical protein
MKPSFLVVAALTAGIAVTASVSHAQGSPPTPPKPKSAMESHHASSSGWKELDLFHELLAETWHPLEHGADFKPIREKAAKLGDAGKAWGASKVPAACDKKVVTDAVAAAVTNSRMVADLVAKQAPDSTVKNAMKKLHHEFEAAEHNCHAK